MKLAIIMAEVVMLNAQGQKSRIKTNGAHEVNTDLRAQNIYQNNGSQLLKQKNSNTQKSRTDSQYFDIFSRPTPTRSASWSIWWSDLMMTMFIMFAALYAFQIPRTSLPVAMPSALNGPTTPESTASADPILNRIHEQLDQVIKNHGVQNRIKLTLVTDTAIHLLLPDHALGTQGLLPELEPCVQEIAQILQSSPYDLAVVGHVATYEAQSQSLDPWSLSMAKARTMINYLVQKAGFPAGRLHMVSYGDQRPVQNPMQQAQGFGNSRVELIMAPVNITAPLALPQEPQPSGFRHWLSASTLGEDG